MKPTILKTWPETEEFVPLLTSPSESKKQTPSFNIDFTGCHTADSCGLAAFLLKIMQYMGKFGKDEAQCKLIGLDNAPLLEKIIKLRFFEPIIGNITNKSLLKKDLVLSNDDFVNSEIFGAHKCSFPLIYIKFDNNDRRTTGIDLLKLVLFERFNEYFQKYTVDLMQLISIFIELVKNTADHADADAIFGMDLCEINKSAKINFFYGDLGIGIMEHIKRYFKEKEKEKINPQWVHFDLSRAYYYACKDGFTTKPESGINFGRGMSTVIEFSKAMDIRLSVFDASSRALLSEFDISSRAGTEDFLSDLYTHSRIRRKFFNFARLNPFCYYGSMEAEIK
jgi:hypothetical protein